MSNIIITGANQGIGYYLAEKLLENGNSVAVLDLETSDLTELKNKFGDKLLTLVCDMRDTEAVDKQIKLIGEKFTSIDIAVHNACLCTFSSMAESDEAVYKDVFEVNYFGALRLARAVTPYMERQGSGKVIFTSSGVGVTGFINISPYSSTKGAIEALAKCLNIEYINKGISFHIFHPPLTNTKSSSSLPVPNEMMANPRDVGYGLAKHINSKRYIICHSLSQKLQTMLCYLFPIKFGRLLSSLTANYEKEQAKS